MDRDITAFLQHLIVEKGFSQNTAEAYRNDLNQFWEFLQKRRNGSSNGSSNGDYPWSSVNLDSFNDYIVELRGRKGYRDTTTARKIAAIRSFFGFLFENGSIFQDPTESLGSPRVGRSLPKFLSKEDVSRLLDAACKDSGNEARRDAAILELLYATGLRVGELVSLNVKDIDLQGSYIRCWGKGSKERIVHLYPKAVKELKQYMTHTRPNLLKNRNGKRPSSSTTGANA